jgi:dual specificity phosphatase 12
MTAGPPSDAAEPDDKAISDVYRSVEETGSLELAAKKLQMYATKQQEEKDNKSKQQKMRQMWADDPEEAGYMAQAHAEDMTEDGEERVDQEEREIMQEEVVHLQEVLPGLWIGDLVAAMDTKGMQERGIVSPVPSWPFCFGS